MRLDRIEALPYPGTVVAGKFEIVRALQSGGMGVVFQARHIVTGRQLALKWLKTSGFATQAQLARFIREAQAAGRIQHPHVVDVYDVGEHQGGHFLVMELLHGESLAERIARGRLALTDAVQLMLPVMHAVAAAHRRGVTHRDLKPDNLFICYNDDGSVWGPKVLDFGISKVEDLELSPLTVTGAVLGTPHYMSPEQLRGLRETDHRTDIYSLGVILFEALTGYLPFSGDSYGAIAIEIATASLPSLRTLRPDLPPAVQAVVEKAVHRDPGERYQTAVEFAEALAQLSPESAGRYADTAPPVAGPFAAMDDASSVRSTPDATAVSPNVVNGGGGTLPLWSEPLRIPPTRAGVTPVPTPTPASTPDGSPRRSRFAWAFVVLAAIGVAGVGAFLRGRTTGPNDVTATTTPAPHPAASGDLARPEPQATQQPAEEPQPSEDAQPALGNRPIPAAPPRAADARPSPSLAEPAAASDAGSATATAEQARPSAPTAGAQDGSGPVGERRRRSGSLSASDF